MVLKALLGNKDGLEKAITGMMAALSSSSSTGASGAEVITLVQSLAALSVSVSGADLENSDIQSVALDLVKVTVITASTELSATEQVISGK